MSIERQLHQLHDDLQSLSANQLEILSSVARALAVSVDFSPPVKSDLATSDFVETMANLLTLHHALHEEPLSKKPFEYTFKNCLLKRDPDAALNPSPGGAAYDVSGMGIRWSLKTEAARGISRKTVRIEKFMEARWVRECNSSESCAREVRDRLPLHMNGYDRIIILRAFPVDDYIDYHLDEIPKSLLLRCFESAVPSQFAKRGNALSFGANFLTDIDGIPDKAFRLLLDSSVEKIRLWYEASHTVTHGRWRIRAAETRRAQQSARTS